MVLRESVHQQRLDGFQSATLPIDRYLITSPALRHLDETRSDRRVNFYDLATSKDEPSMLGLRWINVTDVDIVGPEFPLPITRLQKTARPISFSSDEDNCLKINSLTNTDI